MVIFEHCFRVSAPLSAVAAFHDGPEALEALTPPPMRVELHKFGALKEGMQADFTLWLGPFPIPWKARHEEVGPEGFADVQVEGPLARWRHRHDFVAVSSDETEVRDRVEYEYPSGWSGVWTRALFNNAALRGLFFYRALMTRRGVRRLARK